MARFSFDALGKEARREIRQRKRVFPHLVQTSRMSQAQSHERIAMMEAIAEHFEELAREQIGQVDLFADGAGHHQATGLP